MSGARIPDDWDGSTYDCYRIQWPSSDDWRALLLGQVTEPSQEWFWDDATGDVDEAVSAVLTAEDLTALEFPEVPCGDSMIVPVFKVYLESNQVLSVGSWNLITDWAVAYNLNGAGFNLANSGHRGFYSEGQFIKGVWQYHMQVKFTTVPEAYLGAWMSSPNSHPCREHGKTARDLGMSFQHTYQSQEQWLKMRVLPVTEGTLVSGVNNTYFSGYFVGAIEE